MSSLKRKHENDVEAEVMAKQRRKRASSEPLMYHTVEPNKTEVMKQLFESSCTANAQKINSQNAAEDSNNHNEVNGENKDPLIDSDPGKQNEVTGENKDPLPDSVRQNNSQVNGESIDPLLDQVPSNMQPEQLGFLVCVQETLSFLYGRGFTIENPMFVHLRSHLIQGMNDIATA